MKILIVTFYCTNNYGGFLQAWFLGKFLEENGCEVFYWGSKDLESKIDKTQYNDYKKNRDSMFVESLKQFKIDYDLKTKYDLVIVGSDVVWSSTKNKYFWGKGYKTKKLISFSASTYGMCDIPGLNKKFLELARKIKIFNQRYKLRRFEGIGVRDSKTENLVRKVIYKKNKIVRTIDPTFLPIKAQLNDKILINEKYILVYSYSLIGEQINPVIEYSKKHGCKICVVGYEAKFADYNPAISPFELHSLFKNAEAVFTTTFHGAALAIENNCKFVLFESAKGKELLNEFCLQERLVEPNNALEIIEKPINYKNVNDILEQKRKTSVAFLEKFIK